MTVFAAIQRIPTPIAGLALGIASLGFCLDGRFGFSGALAQVTALISSLLLLGLVAKFSSKPALLKEDLSHAVVGSVLPTSAMAMMVIAASIHGQWPLVANVLWPVAVALHLIFLSAFAYHRSQQALWMHMVPSWFVPPVGIIVAAVTCPEPMFAPVATALLYLGMVAYAVLLPMMLYRLIFHPNIVEPAKPTIAIMAAPASLSLAGYLNMVSEPSPLVVVVLLGIAILMTSVVYVAFFHLLKLPFSPGYAAFTFPMVIGATAMYQCAALAERWGLELSSQLHQIGDIELLVATVVVGYVAFRYAHAYRPRFKASLQQA